ncbi:MAG: glycosyltransferase involved in cell wall biosynthesis/GT2 family glycosyltransferase [Planctomycetota bacterium]
MKPITSVSVLIPTWQGAEFLERVLDRLAAQVIDVSWELCIVDSGSTDGTLELLNRRSSDFPVPLRVVSIHQVEFNHGDTRNQLAAMSASDLLVFLTQDAIPTNSQWLATLVRNFEDEQVGAAYCRNIARPDADPLTVILARDDPGYAEERAAVRLPEVAEYAAMNPHERRVFYNFNDVASAFRRELWERHPFPRTNFGEDVLMARAFLEAGYTIVYDADATVEHSHDYDAQETYQRAETDGRFNVEWLGRVCVASSKDAKTLERRFEASDAEAIRAAGFTGAEAAQLENRASKLRAAAFRGLLDGGAAQLQKSTEAKPATKFLEQASLRLMYVVHGFPPDTWAGTEVYTLNLAREMTNRGHTVTIFARFPADSESDVDFEVEETTFDGLRLLRMTHRLNHPNLATSYHQPRAEAAFREVLQRERPDLVHFQHLIHTSAGLVDVAKQAGIPSVMHCHDYWSLCARVQLIRPDGERCDHNMGLGCHVCVKGEALDKVSAWADRTAWLGPILDSAGRVAEKGLLGGKLADRARAYRDMRERGPFVLGAYASNDLVVSPSRFLRDRLLESGAFDADRFLYSDNGMRTDHVEALKKTRDPDGRLRVGFIGSLVWYKGVDVLIRAINRSADELIVLSIYGDFRPDEDEHHAELQALAGDRVKFCGRFDNAELSSVYADIDVLAVPSIWFENSPITIHEAFLTRTPVVASDIGGMAEYVRDGVDGLQFAVGDDAALARCLERFLREPDLLDKLSEDFLPVKSIAEDAALTEARYRSLCTIVRDQKGFGAIYSATSTEARRGSVEQQGATMLLLRPEGEAAIDYDLRPLISGPHVVTVDSVALAGEQEIALAGRVLLDGAVVGNLTTLRGGKEETVSKTQLDIMLPEGGGRTLTILNLDESGARCYSRVNRVAIEPVQLSMNQSEQAS